MLFHTRTRRNAVVALVLISLLVCGGLGWATMTGLQLEYFEAQAVLERAQSMQEKSNNKTLALALAHLDGIIDSVLSIERTRPYEQFRAYYKPASAIDPFAGAPSDGPIVLPSPLRSFTGPDWVLLHFQVSVTHGWSSPQVDEGLGNRTADGAVHLDYLHAMPADWLAALRDHCDPFTLQQLLESAQQAEIERRIDIARFDAAEHATSAPASSFQQGSVTAADIDRTATEFARRGQRLLDMQRAHLPGEQCESREIAIENLQMGEGDEAEIQPGAACVKVWGTPMLAVWLDVAGEGHRQLALVRSVSVEKSEFCTLQGVLIDWDRLRSVLENEIQELIPGARIEPVSIGAPFDPAMLRTIPARLVCGLPAAPEIVPPMSGLKWGLSLTWSATILALIAICWGTIKYVDILERRMEFVAAVTHELRTPLTSFQIYTDLLSDYGEDSNRRSEYVETLRGESKRLARLVENVLVYSRIGGARPRLAQDLVRPADVLEAASRQLAERCKAAGKQLVVRDDCEPALTLRTDIEFVLQILGNLVENACKYSSDANDPRIWLIAKPWGAGGVAFEVEDLGSGVAAADRRTIFKPFRRSTAAQQGRATGMGLGLALSRYWANSLGGRLELRRGTQNGSQFTRFVLLLPHENNGNSPVARA